MTARIALIGARGYVGAELLRLIAAHPDLHLIAAGSRELAGEAVEGFPDLKYCALTPDDVANVPADCWILALPNDKSAPYCRAIENFAPDAIVIDLSADHRFDPDWVYGLPERNRNLIAGAKRIANPGCYATGMQLVLAPVSDLLDGSPVCFGVSGYSGAGTTPAPKNNPLILKDNLLPYGLNGHLHEREVSHHLGCPVRFLPHVASHFRGILLTIHMTFRPSVTEEALLTRYRQAYGREPLVRQILDIPVLRDGQNTHQATLGGLTVAADGRSATIICALDNLLKGAATQALQNLNLALGFDEYMTISENRKGTHSVKGAA